MKGIRWMKKEGESSGVTTMASVTTSCKLRLAVQHESSEAKGRRLGQTSPDGDPEYCCSPFTWTNQL